MGIGGPSLGYRRPFLWVYEAPVSGRGCPFLVMEGLCRYRRFHYKHRRPRPLWGIGGPFSMEGPCRYRRPSVGIGGASVGIGAL